VSYSRTALSRTLPSDPSSQRHPCLKRVVNRHSEPLGSFGRWFHHRGLSPHQITPMLGVHKFRKSGNWAASAISNPHSPLPNRRSPGLGCVAQWHRQADCGSGNGSWCDRPPCPGLFIQPGSHSLMLRASKEYKRRKNAAMGQSIRPQELTILRSTNGKFGCGGNWGWIGWNSSKHGSAFV
jgi:hypothetical protein